MNRVDRGPGLRRASKRLQRTHRYSANLEKDSTGAAEPPAVRWRWRPTFGAGVTRGGPHWGAAPAGTRALRFL